jgi:hypothetical protein
VSRRALLACFVAVSLAVPFAPSSAAPPPGAVSSNVEYVTTLPEMAKAISLNFIGDTMFVSTQAGLFAYDASNPRKPELVGALPQEIWENEDVDVDPARKLVFISRDPRPAPGLVAQVVPKGSITVVDVSNPAAMLVKSVIVVDGSHTTSCVSRCQWLWSGGPSAFAAPVPPHEAGWKGRPIFGTDLRDPANPKPCPAPIDLGRNDGTTDYSHDVQVDRLGIAWVSGRGGIRGYWTEGRHRNPLTGRVEVADGCRPIPYAGGGTELGSSGSLMHNAWRNPSYAVDGRRGDVLIGTEENITSSCETSGGAATFDLRGSYTGAGWRKGSRLRQLGTWTPEDADGATGCASAHYFADRGDGILAWAFYGQGTRFLDVSDPRRIGQVGYFRPDDASTWGAYFHKGYVFVADNARGIDVIRFNGKGSGRAKTLVAPPSKRTTFPLRFEPSPAFGWLCPVER